MTRLDIDESKWPEELSLKAEKFEKHQYKSEEKWGEKSYIKVFLSVSSLESSSSDPRFVLLSSGSV